MKAIDYVLWGIIILLMSYGIMSKIDILENKITSIQEEVLFHRAEFRDYND